MAHAMAQAVCHWPLIMKHLVQVHMGCVMDKAAMGEDFLRLLRLSPVSVIPPMLHNHSLMYHWCYITLATHAIK
jgi:hypothetical protein